MAEMASKSPRVRLFGSPSSIGKRTGGEMGVGEGKTRLEGVSGVCVCGCNFRARSHCRASWAARFSGLMTSACSIHISASSTLFVELPRQSHADSLR